MVEREVIYDVFDAGLGDLDGDGTLERWTLNHSSAQRVWSENPALGFDQDAGLPGLEPDGRHEGGDGPVGIRMEETTFVVEAGPEGAVSGRVRIPWQTEVAAEGDAEVATEPCAPERNCTIVDLRVGGDGAVRFTPVPPPSDGFPIRFSLDPATDLETVAIGRQGLTPPAHDFTYHSKDRHGFALARLDGRPALFVSRGGARGWLDEVHPEARDELFVRTGEGWVDEAAARGLEKAGCPGRATAWVDADDDGRLDLYQVCGRSDGANEAAPNRLYLQGADGRFHEAAAEVGLALDGGGSFRFLHLDAGGPLAMLWVTDADVGLYEAGEDGRFAPLWSLPRRAGYDIDKIVLADLDGDGAQDALILSPLGNLALPLTRARPEPLDLAALGLPEASADGAALDVDADGRTDLFTVPQGLFLGSETGWLRSDLVDVSWVPGEARLGWFDRDGDGDLDLWVLARGGTRWPRPLGALYRHAPGWAQDAVTAVVGRHPLDYRYWLSEVHENRLDHGRTRRVPAEPGEIVTVVVAGIEGERTERIAAGRDDASRFSATLHDVFVTVPDGATLVTVPDGTALLAAGR